VTTTDPTPDIEGDAAGDLHARADHGVELVTPGQSAIVIPTERTDSLDAFDDYIDDSPLPPRKPKVMTPVTKGLLVGCVAVASFALGARIEKGRVPATASTANATAAALAARLRAAGAGGVAGPAGATGTTVAGAAAAQGAAAAAFGGAAGFGAAPGGAAGGTVGSVQLVDGTNVYIQDTSGNVIKVSTSPDLAITVSKRGTVADLKPGDTITVTGTADADGNIAATAIAPAGGRGTRGAGAGAGAAPTQPAVTTTVKK
jgi:hypothetical protein